MKIDPIFHLTAITMRRDALFQSMVGGRFMARTETAQIGTSRTEFAAWRALETSVREPLEVYAPASGYRHLHRTRSHSPARARRSQKCNLCSVRVSCEHRERVCRRRRHRYSLRRADGVGHGNSVPGGSRPRRCHRVSSLTARSFTRRSYDLVEGRFDLTLPFGKQSEIRFTVPEPPKLEGPAQYKTVRDVQIRPYVLWTDHGGPRNPRRARDCLRT